MSDRLRVATWNCFGVPSGLFGVVFGAPHLPERFRVAQIARALASYDVICVQESFLDSVAEFLVELADLLGMQLWHDRMLARVRERSVYGGGLAILAPQPLDVTFEIFPEVALGFDAWATKGFATCELTTRSGARYRIVNLHMQADEPHGDQQAYGATRASQVATLMAAIDRMTGDLPMVLCGDLNVPEGSDEYHQVLMPAMRHRGLVDVAEGLGLHTYSPQKNALLRALDPHATDVRVDYVWTSDSTTRRWKVVTPPTLFLTEALAEEGREPLFASDHFGVGVELELEEKVREAAATR